MSSRINEPSSKVLLVKVVMLGDAAVGKTSLVQRFVRESFGGRYKRTMGLDLSIKEVILPQATVKIQLWDMGGQISFKPLRLRFYGGARGAMLVYDATRPSTFHNLQIWLQELEANVPTQIPFIILGNKSDLGELCVVSEEDEIFWASESKALANYRTSAKTGENVEKAFHNLGEKIISEILKINKIPQISSKQIWDET
ncbi:MAG: Rab family GTPase [Candidatus Hodarchaeota archaeon]